MSDKIVTVTIKGDDQLTPALHDGAEGLDALQKAAEEAAKAQRELEQETERFGQQQQQAATVTTQRETATDKLSGGLQKAVQKERELAQATRDTATATQNSTSKLDGLISGINKLGGVMAAVETGRQILDFTKEGSAVLGVSKSFDGLSASVGKTSDVFLNELRAASNGYIKDTQLMQTANKAVLLGGQDMATALPTLLKIAGASARATGEDFQFIFDSLVTGISRGSVEILDNAGLTINLAKVQDDYAKTLGKTGDQLTDVEEKQALLNEVLVKGEGFVDKIGTSADATGGALQRLETRFQNFTDKIKSDAAVGLEYLLGGTTELTNALIDLQVRGFAIGNYDQYIQKMQEAGLSDEALSREAYAAAQAMIAKGTASRDASAGVTGLADAEAVLRDMLFQQVNAGQLSEEQMSTLIQRTLELAATNPTVSASLLDVITTMSDGRDGADELTQYLDALSINQEFAASTAYGYADAQQAAYDATVQSTDAAAVHIATTFQLTDAEYENANAKLVQGLEAERARQFEEDLALAVAMSADGALDAEVASIRLAQAYGIERSEAANLIAMTNELNAARSGRMGSIAGNALEGTLNRMAGTRSGGITAPYTPAKRGGRSGGSGSGKSEAVREAEREAKELEKIQDRLNKEFEKANKQREKLDQEHTAELAKIWDRWRAEELAATEKFNTDKFQDRVANAKSLVDVDQDLWDEAKRLDVKFWDESQKIAQAGDAQKADAFYKAATEYTAMKTQHAQELRDLDAKIASEEDAIEKQKLQQKQQRLKDIYAEEEKLAGEGLDKILAGQEEIDKARDDALAKENADYTKAQQDLATSFAENVQEVVKSSDKVKDSISGLADHLIGEFGRISAATSMAPAAASPAAEPVVDGSHALGLKRVPFDNYIARLHKDERILTRDEAKAHDQVMAGNQQRDRVPLRPSQASAPSSAPTNISMPLIFNGAKPAASPALTTMQRELEAAVKPIVDRYIEQDRKKRIMRG